MTHEVTDDQIRAWLAADGYAKSSSTPPGLAPDEREQRVLTALADGVPPERIATLQGMDVGEINLIKAMWWDGFHLICGCWRRCRPLKRVVGTRRCQRHGFLWALAAF